MSWPSSLVQLLIGMLRSSITSASYQFPTPVLGSSFLVVWIFSVAGYCSNIGPLFSHWGTRDQVPISQLWSMTIVGIWQMNQQIFIFPILIFFNKIFLFSLLKGVHFGAKKKKPLKLLHITCVKIFIKRHGQLHESFQIFSML